MLRADRPCQGPPGSWKPVCLGALHERVQLLLQGRGQWSEPRAVDSNLAATVACCPPATGVGSGAQQPRAAVAGKSEPLHRLPADRAGALPLRASGVARLQIA